MQAETMQAVAARLHQLQTPEPGHSGAAEALDLLNIVNEKGRELAHKARWALLTRPKPTNASCLLTTKPAGAVVATKSMRLRWNAFILHCGKPTRALSR